MGLTRFCFINMFEYVSMIFKKLKVIPIYSPKEKNETGWMSLQSIVAEFQGNIVLFPMKINLTQFFRKA